MRDELNSRLAMGLFAMNFVITDRLMASFAISLFFFIVGKCVDLFLKPKLDEYRNNRGRRPVAVTDHEHPCRTTRRIGFIAKR